MYVYVVTVVYSIFQTEFSGKICNVILEMQSQYLLGILILTYGLLCLTDRCLSLSYSHVVVVDCSNLSSIQACPDLDFLALLTEPETVLQAINPEGFKKSLQKPMDDLTDVLSTVTWSQFLCLVMSHQHKKAESTHCNNV